MWTLNEGIISNRYPAENDRYAGVLQTQVPLQPGSSGGPVINRAGQVVGVVTAKLRSGDNTGFCIQSNLVRRLLLQHEMKRGAQLAVDGAVRGAELWVDGQMRGTVPLLVVLPPGAHDVEVRQSGKVVKRSVTLAAGEVQQVLLGAGDMR
ncbi:MAG: trypsin-like peptidase domain-containing protein [Myxococcota bacterium]